MSSIWPTYKHIPTRASDAATGLLPNSYMESFTLVALSKPPVGSLVLNIEGSLFATDGSDQGNIYCVSPSGSLAWTHATGQLLTSARSLVASDGTLYVAGSKLLAFTTKSDGSGPKLKFSYAFNIGGTCMDMVISADGKRLYALVVETRFQYHAASIVALNLPTSSGNQPELAWTGWLGNGSGYSLQASTGLVLDNDGGLYVATIEGSFHRIAPDNGAGGYYSNLSQTPIQAITIGLDDTVYVLANFGSGYYQIVWARTKDSTRFEQKPISTPFCNNPETTICAALDGSVYTASDRLYKFVPSAQFGYIKAWQSDPYKDHGDKPKHILIDSAGSVLFCGTDLWTGSEWLVIYSSEGQLLWNHQLTNTATVKPCLSATGVLYYCDGNTICATSPSTHPALVDVYTALIASRTPATNDTYSYPLDSSTIADATLLALVTRSLGEGSRSITGSLSLKGTSLTLDGTGSWLSASEAKVTLTFTVVEDTINLDSKVEFGPAFNLGQAIPALEYSFWGQLNLANLSIQQSASALNTESSWNANATITFEEPLTQAASLLDSPPGQVACEGMIAIGTDGNPIVELKVVGSLNSTLSKGWTLPVSLVLTTSYDTTYKFQSSSIQLSAKLKVSDKEVMLTANVPVTAGTVLFSASFSPVLNITSINELIFWPNKISSGLSDALPNSVATQSTPFGLRQIQFAVAPSMRKVTSVTIIFSAADYTVFSVGNPGVSMSIRDVEVFTTVVNPLGNPTYQVGLSGTIDFNNAFCINAQVVGPKWVISGSAGSSTSVTPMKAIAALGGSQTLPSTAPTGAFGIIDFYADPEGGTYFVKFESNQTWPLFEIGSFSASLANFYLSVDRIISNPSTGAGLISVQTGGQLTIGGAIFDLAAYVPSDGDWNFSARLSNTMGLPSIGDLLDSVSPNLSAGLPSQITKLGSNIIIRQLDLSVTDGGDHYSAMLAVGSTPGWDGWNVISEPFTFGLTDALVKVDLDSNRPSAPTALLHGTFTIGSAGLRVQMPLPFDSNDFVFELADDDIEGVAFPSVGQLVELVNSDWASGLPSTISDLGSNITLFEFQLRISARKSGSTATFEFKLGATDTAAAWSPVGIAGFGLSNLGVGGKLTYESSRSSFTSEGKITAALHIGENGYIPLQASMKGNLSTWSIQLDSSRDNKPKPPTVGDIIGLFDTTGWATKLPTQITSLGESMVIEKFSIDKDSSTKSVDVCLASDNERWEPFELIPGFSGLRVTGYSLKLNYNSKSRPTYYGSLNINGTLLDPESAASVSMQMPNFILKGEWTPANLNMKYLCQQLISNSASAPDWLASIGIQQVTLEIDMEKNLATIKGLLIDRIDLGPAGSLNKVYIEVAFGGGEKTSICLSATWKLLEGAEIPGKICYPFKDLSPNLKPSRPIRNFARPRPPSPPTPPRRPPWTPPSEPIIPPALPTVLVPTFLLDLIGPIGVTITATILSTAFITYLMSDNEEKPKTDNAAICVAAAIDRTGNNPSQEQLNEIAAAIAKTFTHDLDQIALALSQGAIIQNVTLTREQIARALVSLSQIIPSEVSPINVGHAILVVFPKTTPNDLTKALSDSYTLKQTGPILPVLLSSKSSNACTTANAVLVALKAGYPSASDEDLITVLANSGFTPGECVPLFTSSVTTAPAMAALLAGAKFDSLQSAQALYQNYTDGLRTAEQMARVMLLAYPNLTTDVKTMWSILWMLTYSASDVLSVMKKNYPNYKTSSFMIIDAMNAGFQPRQIAAELLSLYRFSATELACELLQANRKMNPSDIMAALLAAAVSVQDAATAFLKLAPNPHNSANNDQNLANALAKGGYSAMAVLRAEITQFDSSVSTSIKACKLLYDTNVISKAQAKKGLLALGFKSSDVENAIKECYG